MTNGEKGQATLLVILSMAIFLLGAIGLALDGAQLYAHREMAQAAADAAAEAGVFSIFAGTFSVPAGGAQHTCAAADITSPATSVFGAPCGYANANGFMTANDTVVVSFPASPYNGVTGTSNAKYPYPFEQVTITRTVGTSFMKFFGTSSSSIKAIGGAGIVQTSSPVPILVLDPTGSPSFQVKGTPNVQICGGPKRSIQVNSNAAGALDVKGSATVDLSKAGPADSGTCTTGTGGDFGVFGSSSSTPSWLTPFGSTEHYLQPAAPINDPLASVNPPSKPANGTSTNSGAGTTAGSGDCPVTASKGCTIFNPGYYSKGIQVKNSTAVMQPGIYYLDDSFSTDANSDVVMCSTTCVADTSGCCSNNGVMIYLSKTAGPVNVGANAGSTMLGSSPTSSYKGILFFVDRGASDQNPSLGGGGSISLSGTIYMPSQTLSFSGHAGSTTLIKGEMIVNDLTLGGNSGITMELSPTYTLPVDQVALVK